jgi:hypothetical protein
LNPFFAMIPPVDSSSVMPLQAECQVDWFDAAVCYKLWSYANSSCALGHRGLTIC